MLKLKVDTPQGILNADQLLPDVRPARYAPSTDLAPYVEHYWTVDWNLTQPRIVETIPQPAVHLVVEAGSTEINGVATARFRRTLEGTSRVVGVRFRPGGFRPFIAVPVSTYSERVVAATSVFGATAACLSERVLAHREPGASIAVIEDFLRALRPRADPTIDSVAALVARIATDREITKVEHVSSAYGIDKRRLQRLFDDYVGVGPKWVIQRYRLLEAAARIAATTTPAWSRLALDLGYADQAHFIRDFKQLVGVSPAEYWRSVDPAR